jgi:hypothetical protein
MSSSLQLRVRVLEAENQKNREKVITLEAALNREKELRRQENARRVNQPALIDGIHYNFDRTNVVHLSQFISRYLENKPAEVDANKIFGCIRSCYMDLKKDYNDNPEHYAIDMRMLLATCYASTWFTEKQVSNFWNWLCERNWN